MKKDPGNSGNSVVVYSMHVEAFIGKFPLMREARIRYYEIGEYFVFKPNDALMSILLLSGEVTRRENAGSYVYNLLG